MTSLLNISTRLTRCLVRQIANQHNQNLINSSIPTSYQSIRSLETEPAHIKSIVDQIAALKFHEVTILNEALKRELKIPDVQNVVAANIPADPDNAAGEEAGASGGVKSSFTVKLTKFDESKKVSLIKEIKKLIEGMNLVEAKRFVEDCPKVIKSNLTKDEAEALQKQLEAAGGIVKLE